MNSYNWYVVNTKPRQEDLAERMITQIGVDVFYPKINEKKGLFPRLSLCPIQSNGAFQKIRYSRGVRDIVSYGYNPVSVEDDIVETIKARIRNGFVQISNDLFKRGRG